MPEDSYGAEIESQIQDMYDFPTEEEETKEEEEEEKKTEDNE